MNGSPSPVWIRSSRCSDGNCIEIAVTADAVLIRDSKVVSGPTLAVSAAEWRRFANSAKAGEFDTP
jgi:Domain of unknown function (DUF397)